MKCPYLKRKQAGDESYGWCELDEVLCSREYGYGCDTYKKILDEDKDDEDKYRRLLGVA